MQALVLDELKQPLRLEQRPDPEPAAGEVVVELSAAALNRRDFWITQGLYPGITLPCVLGSDGAGVVTACGEGVTGWEGAEVLINPGWNWGNDPAVQADDFAILGLPRNGTFATHVVVPADVLHRKPAHLDWPAAAALPLAGLTAYRALVTRGGVKAGERVLVTGIGGGVATFALQFAAALGATVVVTSSSEEKRRRAIELGAAAAYDYTADGWAKSLLVDHGPVDLAIDGAGGDGYASLLHLAAPGGRIVNYGATAGPPPKVDLFKVFWKQLNLLGSTMGSPADFTAMLDLVSRYEITPVVDAVLPLAEGNAALDRLRESSQFGKVVLDTSV